MQAAVGFALVLMALVSSAALAATTTHRSGGYEFDVGPPAEWTNVHHVADAWDAKAAGSDNGRLRYWLLDAQIDRRHGAAVHYYDRAIEARSPELIGDVAKPQIAFNPEYQRLVLHRVELRRDGAWLDRLRPDSVTLARRESEFERDMSTGTVSALIVLDDVRVGDLVRFSYSIVGENPVLGGLVDDEFVFALTEPVLDRYVRVLYDADAELLVDRGHDTPEPTQRRTGAMLEWSAVRHAAAPITDEGIYPAWYAPLPTLTVAPRRRWADVATWARSLYPTAQLLPSDLEQKIEQWKKIGDADLRIGAALRAVQEDVRYFGVEIGASTHKPSEPADTWTRRYGDCKDKARLLSTVLARLGFDARPALVSANQHKAVASLPPAASAFDHVIVQVRLPDTVLWLDPTQTQQRGSPRLIASDDFGVALPVGEDVRDLVLVERPRGTVDRVRAIERLHPSAVDRSVALEVETEYVGAAADRLRRNLQFAGRDQAERNYVEYYRKRYGDVTADGGVAVSDDEAANTLRLTESYLLKDPWVAGTGAERVIETYADSVGAAIGLPSTAQRSAPLPVAHPVDIEQRFELLLPAGWGWLSEARQQTLENAAMSLDFAQRREGRTLSVTYRYRSHADLVEVAAYPQHFALLRQAGDLLGRRLLLALPVADAQKQRDDRLKNLMRGIMEDSKKSTKKKER